MPFERIFPRTFSAASIGQHAPAASGVYGLTNAAGWIFIGETDNIQAALMEHLQAGPGGTVPQVPSGFVFEECDASKRYGRQDRLVLEYGPAGNRNLAR